MKNTKSKVVLGLWANIGVSDLNRLLRPHNVRLVLKRSKEWGDQVSVTAHAIDEVPAPVAPAPGVAGG